ncbi:MAG: hypothetical protein M0D57_11715 [Sphingobacteriales bacterium JAD_PAG50586_3]|nr:MAG: hypothetical protein M0D57_11715 [Sphingobacteriales bacterium JAD_PAG50586_3]
MKSRFKRTNEKNAQPKSFSFAELLTSKPTKKMKQVAGKAKKLTKSSAPEAFIPHEDTEF